MQCRRQGLADQGEVKVMPVFLPSLTSLMTISTAASRDNFLGLGTILSSTPTYGPRISRWHGGGGRWIFLYCTILLLASINIILYLHILNFEGYQSCSWFSFSPYMICIVQNWRWQIRTLFPFRCRKISNSNLFHCSKTLFNGFNGQLNLLHQNNNENTATFTAAMFIFIWFCCLILK